MKDSGAAKPGVPAASRAVAGAGDADVDEHGAVALAVEQDVGRLDVAVDHADRVHRVERVGDLERDLRDRVGRQPLAALVRRAQHLASGWPSTSSITK